MKLLRYGTHGKEKPGMLDDAGVIRDLTGIIDEVAGEALFPKKIEYLSAIDHSSLPVVSEEQRFGPCVE